MTAPIRKIRALRFLERLTPSPVPRNAKPTTGIHKNRALLEFSPNRSGPSEAMLEPALMVIEAFAFPLASKVTEFELSEQVGAPTRAGCTEQLNETGLS